MTGKDKHKVKNIEDLHEKVINAALMACFLFSFFIQFLVLLRSKKYGTNLAFVIQTVALFGFLPVIVFRKRINVEVKTLVIAFLIFIVFSTGLFSYGYLASGKLYIVLICILVLFSLDLKKAIFTLGLLLMTYALFGFLYTNEILSYPFDVASYMSNKNNWILEGGIISITCIGVLIPLHMYRNRLLENYFEIENHTRDLENSEKKYRMLFEASNDAIALIHEYRFFDCNNRALELFDCSRDSIIGREIYDLSPEYQSDGKLSQIRADHFFSEVLNGKPQIFDWVHRRTDGIAFDVSVSLNMIEIDKVNYFQAVLRDITEKKRIEAELENHRKNLEQLVSIRTEELKIINEELKETNEELFKKNQIVRNQNEDLSNVIQKLKETQMQFMQVEKMASLGILTAGVAHEINNPLNFISGGHEGLEEIFRSNGNLDSKHTPLLLDSIKTGLKRVSSIVNSLNHFSRNVNTLDENVDVYQIIDNCLIMLQNKTKDRIEIIKQYNTDKLVIRGNVGKIHQVFLNILNNAIQAINEEGKIIIKIMKRGKFLSVRISDSGIGIPKENMPRITDPFFTTKNPGEGTGLGLSISFSIVEEHNGLLEFESEPGDGTSVTVSLPVNIY